MAPRPRAAMTPPAQLLRQRPLRTANFDLDSPGAVSAWAQRLNQQSSPATETSETHPKNNDSPKVASQARPAISNEIRDPSADKPIVSIKSNEAAPIVSAPVQTKNGMIHSDHAPPQEDRKTRLPGRTRQGSGPAESRPHMLERINNQLRRDPKVSEGNPQHPSTTTAIQTPKSGDLPNMISRLEINQSVAPPQHNAKPTLDTPNLDAGTGGSSNVQTKPSVVQSRHAEGPPLNLPKSNSIAQERASLAHQTMMKLEEVRTMLEKLDSLDAQLANKSEDHAAWDSPLETTGKEYFTPLAATRSPAESRSTTQQENFLFDDSATSRKTLTGNADAFLTNSSLHNKTPFQGGIIDQGGVPIHSEKSNTTPHGNSADINKKQSQTTSEAQSASQSLVQVEPSTRGIWQTETTVTGVVYYYHTGTKATTYLKPKPWSTVSERVSRQPWRIRSTAEGRRCYINTETNESVWDMPDALRQALGAQSHELSLHDFSPL